MTIAVIEPDVVLARCRRALGLPEAVDVPADDALIAALLRHSAGFLCPCSRATLRSSLLESLQLLDENTDNLPGRIDRVIEGLIVGGDLLELNDVATDDPDAKGTWVFAAPPSYVLRPGGSAFLIGVVPDHDTLLPPTLSSRIVHEGVTRTIAPRPGEDLADELASQGLQELSEEAWLKSPRAEAADDMLAIMERRLESQPPSGAINELKIIDPERAITYYRGRWVEPKRHSGIFVARRPQDYGAPIWCAVLLNEGAPERLVDLPISGSRWRGCDVAWHLQMAIDHCRGVPQLYRRHRVEEGVRLDFFSPLPQWAERRLMIFGGPVPREKSLMSYVLPAPEAEAEEDFLKDRLWLAPTDDAD